MKIVTRDNSSQVLDSNGRLVATFPTVEAAQAFGNGYRTGVKDSAEVFTRRAGEFLDELNGRAG
jgi:hypothetical protein